MFELQRKFTSQNVKTHLLGNKLVFKKNKNVFKEEVLVALTEDVVHCDERKLEKLHEMPGVASEENNAHESRFMASWTPVKSMARFATFTEC